MLVLAFSNVAVRLYLALFSVIFCLWVRWTTLQLGCCIHYRHCNIYPYLSYFNSTAHHNFFSISSNPRHYIYVTLTKKFSVIASTNYDIEIEQEWLGVLKAWNNALKSTKTTKGQITYSYFMKAENSTSILFWNPKGWQVLSFKH